MRLQAERMDARDVELRRARRQDLEAIVALLAEDKMGALREDRSLPLPRRYRDAFEAIEADPNQQLMVALSEGQVVGTLQLTLIPGISRLGAWRGQIEAVRIAKEWRGSGLGTRLFEWVIRQCRERGCSLVQLTTDKRREDAHRFYERLGFVASHEGYKIQLPKE